MKLTNNSINFVKKICSDFNLSEKQVLELLQERVHGDRICEIENGEIEYLSIRGLAHAKASILRKEGKREPVEILDATQIDLSNLSNLTHLDFVSRYKNDTSIPTYDFTFCPELRTLVFKMHKTRSINISNCVELAKLDCSSNALDSLGTSNNLELKKINCQFNPIESLDLSQNSKLTYLLANSTDLTGENLVFPNDNHISELHLRNTKIKRFNPNRFDELSVCRLSGLDQDSFDTKKNQQLLRLELSNCKIQYVNIKESHLLSEFEVNGSNLGEIVCNEFQAYAIPFLSKQFKLSQNQEQSKVLETISLHKQASNHNWDEGLSKLKKILKNTNCDISTATMIYWKGQPNYFLKYNKANDALDFERELFRFLTKLEKRILADEFNTNIIDFNPSTYLGTNWVQELYNPETSVREIPPLLKEEIKGNKIKVFDLAREYKGNCS